MAWRRARQRKVYRMVVAMENRPTRRLMISTQLQIERHSYRLVAGFKTWRCEQPEVPIGGTIGVWIGVIEGGTRPQTAGAQSGGKSMELSHKGWTSPSTQRQTQDASAFAIRRLVKTRPRISRISCLLRPGSPGQSRRVCQIGYRPLAIDC